MLERRGSTQLTVVSSMRLMIPLTVYDPSSPFLPTLAWVEGRG